MAKRIIRKPVTGEAFDSDQMNEPERIEAYISELEYYRPRGFSKLVKEGRRIAADMRSDDAARYADSAEHGDSWKDDVESLLTEWARRAARHDYIHFGPLSECGSVGFWIDAESARSDADIDLPAGDSVPRGFSGLAFFVTDHGNAHAAVYSRGRKCRELFSIV
jgi:hypothetical protein